MSFFFDRWLRFLAGALVLLFFLISVQNVYAPPLPPPAPTYSNSAHGNTGYGVDRSTIDGTNPFPDADNSYATGHCAHCHEQHASVGGVSTTPSKYVLFYDNYIDQTNAFCFKCHDNTTTYATTAIVNRSYSFRAGGWTDDTLNDILEAFSDTSSHNLANIRTFLSDTAPSAWGYNADSNPCVACHNPHTVQGDPGNASNSVKSSATRGYLVSRPTEHANLSTTGTWNIWGDQQTGETETMSDYTNYYQAPYRVGGAIEPYKYEPDGSDTTNGSNLTDYVTFCQDCHSDYNMSAYGLSNTPIDWDSDSGTGDAVTAGDKHGKNAGTTHVYLNAPYAAAWTANDPNGIVLACTDCHEPHGAPNLMLIRNEVNGGTLTANITIFDSDYWEYVCAKCHSASMEVIHHTGTDAPYDADSKCSSCHDNTCSDCHHHGSIRTDCDNLPTTRVTF